MQHDDPRLKLAARFISIETIQDGQRYTVGGGDSRMGKRGQAVAILSVKHAQGYAVLLQMDDGTQDTFHPMQLFPDTQAGVQGQRGLNFDMSEGYKNG